MKLTACCNHKEGDVLLTETFVVAVWRILVRAYVCCQKEENELCQLLKIDYEVNYVKKINETIHPETGSDGLHSRNSNVSKRKHYQW